MRGLNMSWFYFILFLSFIIGKLEASHHQKNPSAVVVGTVYCDTCFQDDFSKSSHLISGASVAVECNDETSKPSFRQEVKTDEHGEFKVHLPFSVSKHVKKIKRCSVKLVSSSEPYCAVASTATSSSLRLKERKQGIHIFSAGFFTFKPLKQPYLCNQKPSVENSKELNSKKTSVPPFNNPAIFPPPIQDPTTPDLPSIPLLPGLPPLPPLPPLPLPPLPSLPPVPGFPNLPPIPGNVPEKKPEEPSTVTKLSEQKTAHPEFFIPPLPPNPFLPAPTLPPNPLPLPPLFPPNPLQPSPLLPPNPLQPSPLLPPNPLQPSPLLPPNPLLPSPSPLIPLPPVPGLTPPSPPSFPFPLPPIPPRFPGIPPASSSPKKLSP